MSEFDVENEVTILFGHVLIMMKKKKKKKFVLHTNKRSMFVQFFTWVCILFDCDDEVSCCFDLYEQPMKRKRVTRDKHDDAFVVRRRKTSHCMTTKP